MTFTHGRMQKPPAGGSKGDSVMHLATYNMRGRTSLASSSARASSICARIAPPPPCSTCSGRGALDEGEVGPADVAPMYRSARSSCCRVSRRKRSSASASITPIVARSMTAPPMRSIRACSIARRTRGPLWPILGPPEISEQLDYEGEIASSSAALRAGAEGKAASLIAGITLRQRRHHPRLDPARPLQRHPGRGVRFHRRYRAVDDHRGRSDQAAASHRPQATAR